MIEARAVEEIGQSDPSLAAQEWKGGWFWPVIGLPIAVVLLRLPTFLQSVIDNDESVYLVFARSLLAGHAPYTEAWGNTPPGIYFLFAAAGLIFGTSVASIRILACLAVIASCVALYRLVRRLTSGSRSAGAFAGLLFAVSSLGYGGTASNTEIFFIPLVLWAMDLLLGGSFGPRPSTRRALRYLGSGLLLGAAMQIKFVVFLDVLAAMAFILILSIRSAPGESSRKWLGRTIGGCFAVGLGVAIWFGIVAGYFQAVGHFGDYWYANFTVNRSYVSTSLPVMKQLRELKHGIWDNQLLWLGAVVGFAALIWPNRNRRGDQLALALSLVWFAITFAVLPLTGKYFSHYFLQLLPPLCLISGLLFHAISGGSSTDRRAATLLGLLLLSLPMTQVALPALRKAPKIVYQRWVKHVPNYGDEAAAQATYLKSRIKPGTPIYIVDGSTIEYILADAMVPTKYVFSAFLTHDYFRDVAKVDNRRELALIMEKSPVYVTMPPK